SDAVTTGQATIFNATSTNARISFGSTLAAGANDLTITADEIDFTGGNTISGSGALLLQPNNPLAAIKLGAAAAGNPGPVDGALDLSTTDLAALANGFTSIRIGRTDGSHQISINGATFKDPVTIKAPQAGGTITLTGAGLTGTDDASLTLYALGTPGQP